MGDFENFNFLTAYLKVLNDHQELEIVEILLLWFQIRAQRTFGIINI